MGCNGFHPQTGGFLLFHGHLAGVLFGVICIKPLQNGNYKGYGVNGRLSTDNLQAKFFL